MIAPAARGWWIGDGGSKNEQSNIRALSPLTSHLSPKKPLHSKLIKPHQNEDFRI